MARRSFTDRSGRRYSDAPAGWLKAAKDDWNDRLRQAGHRMKWRKITRNSYEGTCRKCGGGVCIGHMYTTLGGTHDIRGRRCR